MTKLPKWLLPAGLAAGVVTALALVRKPSIKAGDVVAVPKATLIALLPGGLPAELNALPNLVQIQKFAVRVASEANGKIAGQAIGWIDPASNMPVGAIAGPPVTVSRAQVTDYYRDGKKIG